MDDRWHIQEFLEKMVALLRQEFPDHKVEPAKSALIRAGIDSEVRSYHPRANIQDAVQSCAIT